MHEATPYGHLIAAGVPITADELARIVGESARDVTRWLEELGRRQVYSVTPDGVIFSRRMVRDEREREQWRDRQGRHRGQSRDTEGDTARDNAGGVTAKSRRSSSSLSSSYSKEERSLPSGEANDTSKPVSKVSKKKPRTEIPDDWPNFEAIGLAREFWLERNRPDLAERAEDEAQRFRDHHLAKGTSAADWRACWRTWMSRAVDFKPNSHGNRPMRGGMSAAAGIAMAAGDDPDE